MSVGGDYLMTAAPGIEVVSGCWWPGLVSK